VVSLSKVASFDGGVVLLNWSLDAVVMKAVVFTTSPDVIGVDIRILVHGALVGRIGGL
jgi:hypothetical protein